jgi:TrmH family RNA methyltransferase
VKHISSRDNPDYRRLHRLARSGRARREAGVILLDGEHLIEAYAKAFGTGLLSVVARASSADRPEIQGHLHSGQGFTVLADGLFNEVSPVNTPTGILAIAVRPDPALLRAPESGFTAFLDGVQDPGNLGTILRSAAAAGASQAVLSRQCADPWSPKCLRGGMGAQFLLPVHEGQDLAAAITAFPGRVVAAELSASASLFEADLGGPLGLVVGAEGQGVSAAVLAGCPDRVRIPMAAGVESLNAAAAATVLFYEWLRQNGGEGGLAGGWNH